jgi:hypothetical protein
MAEQPGASATAEPSVIAPAPPSSPPAPSMPAPPPIPAALSRVTLDSGAMSLSFDVAGSAQPLQGSVLRGKGFRVWADWIASDYGTLRFYFQQMYRGLPLNEWSGGDSYPAAFEGGVSIDLPAPEDGAHRVSLEYDLHTLRLTVSNATALLTNYVLWRDNMTDALGTNGPNVVTVDHPGISNVSFTPAVPRAASPYVWEGVVGNTSRALVGPSVHSPWWPISKMVSRGTNVFYTGGYNEGKWDVQKFDVSNPQVVITNFSASGRKQLGVPFPVDMSYPDDHTLLVKYSDTNVVAFDPVTSAKTAEHLVDWSPPEVQVPTADSSALAVHPEDNGVAAVYYHTTDQVVIYTNAATPGGWGTNFVIGAAGGYANGPSVLMPTNTTEFRQTVKLSGFYYDADGTTNADARITNAVLCFQSDGKLWVSDTLTSRMLRFDTNGLCDAWFMFVAHTYSAYVDPNDPARLFAGHLEFAVDYTNAISNCWTLKNCWTRFDDGTEVERRKATQNGLFSAVTLTNSGMARTFALAMDPTKYNRLRLVELTPRGVRATDITDQSPLLELETDGSTITMSVGPTPQTGTTAAFFRDYISGWAGADPVYSRASLGSVDYTDNVCPIYWGGARLRGSKLFLFYPGKNQFERNVPEIPFTGSHLGAVDLAQSGSWLWMNAPTGPLDGKGCFETNCHYAGSGFTIVDDDIFFVYRGEGWRGGQANQIFHYKTDGTFVGQFGTPAFVQGTLLNAPGAGSNVGNISGVKVNGTIYLYTSDEWSHGVHRWRIENTRSE